MVDPRSIEDSIRAGLDCTHVEVQGDGAHFEATIVSPAFAGLNRVRRHQLVYGALGDRMVRTVSKLGLAGLRLGVAIGPPDWMHELEKLRMIVPKRHVDSLAQVDASHAAVLGRMMAIAGRLAQEQGATDGFRTIINTGRVGRQDVYHLHIHIIGGPDPLPRMIAGK